VYSTTDIVYVVLSGVGGGLLVAVVVIALFKRYERNTKDAKSKQTTGWAPIEVSTVPVVSLPDTGAVNQGARIDRVQSIRSSNISCCVGSLHSFDGSSFMGGDMGVSEVGDIDSVSVDSSSLEFDSADSAESDSDNSGSGSVCQVSDNSNEDS